MGGYGCEYDPCKLPTWKGDSTFQQRNISYHGEIDKIRLYMFGSWHGKSKDEGSINLSFYEEARKAREWISSKHIIEERKNAGSSSNGYFLLSSNGLSDEEEMSFVRDYLRGGYTLLLTSVVAYFLGQSAQDLELVKVINEALRCGNIAEFVHQKALEDVRYKVH
uniref:Uncharacterized protein n=1 Tax=Leersia perrieri TaxID=77586 RepID=A0A0D9W5P4_9ORYZ